MTIEKTNGTENITETLSGVVGNFSKTLKKFMDDLMGPINKIFEKLQFKEKEETQQFINNSKIDLKKLMKDVNSKVKVDLILNDDEKEILDNILTKNTKLQKILEQIDTEFGKDMKDRQGALFMSMLKKETDGGEIEQSELDKIIEDMEKNQAQIEKDTKLKGIINEINKDDTLKEKYTIKAIVEAYNKTQKQIDDGSEKILNKTTVLKNIESFNS